MYKPISLALCVSCDELLPVLGLLDLGLFSRSACGMSLFLRLNNDQPLFCLIKHSFTPTAWNCVTKQRSPLACMAVRTMWRGSVTPNNSTIFIQQPGSDYLCAKMFHMTLWVRLSSKTIQRMLVLSKRLIIKNNFGSRRHWLCLCLMMSKEYWKIEASSLKHAHTNFHWRNVYTYSNTKARENTWFCCC